MFIFNMQILYVYDFRYNTERKRFNRNRATLAVARKLVAYMMAVDKRSADFSLEMKKEGRPETFSK